MALLHKISSANSSIPESQLFSTLRLDNEITTLIATQQSLAQQAYNDAWNYGVQLGQDMAGFELDMLGYPADPIAPDQAYLESVIADLDTNMSNAQADMTRTLRDMTVDDLEKFTRFMYDLNQRLSAGASVLPMRGYTEAHAAMLHQVETDADVRVKVVWFTDFSANTCPECAALHGQEINLGEEFDSSLMFGNVKAKPTFGGLEGPPRHPNCACLPVVYIEGASPFDTSAMREVAANYGESHFTSDEKK